MADQLYHVRFYAGPHEPRSWPEVAQVNSSYPLDNTIRLAQSSMEHRHFPWARRFEIIDNAGAIAYSSPEYPIVP